MNFCLFTKSPILRDVCRTSLWCTMAVLDASPVSYLPLSTRSNQSLIRTLFFFLFSFILFLRHARLCEELCRELACVGLRVKEKQTANELKGYVHRERERERRESDSRMVSLARSLVQAEFTRRGFHDASGTTSWAISHVLSYRYRSMIFSLSLLSLFISPTYAWAEPTRESVHCPDFEGTHTFAKRNSFKRLVAHIAKCSIYIPKLFENLTGFYSYFLRLVLFGHEDMTSCQTRIRIFFPGSSSQVTHF